MSIEFREASGRFHLQTDSTSYVMELVEGAILASAYWGPRIRLSDDETITCLHEVSSFSPNPLEHNAQLSFDTLPREYPDFGRSDYAPPAFELQDNNGFHIVAADVKNWEIFAGAPQLEGLPCLHHEDTDDVQTLKISMQDDLTGVSIELYYAVFPRYDAIARHAVFRNVGHSSFEIRRAMSLSTDFFLDSDFDLIHLPGAWANERQVSRIPLGKAGHTVESRRGASSHEQNPFLALVRPQTGEDSGLAFGFQLLYSGSFLAQAAVNAYGKTRVQMGLNPADFSWKLESGQSFTTPQALLSCSARGLGGLSDNFHRLYRQRLGKSPWREKIRPVLINNWEATYFDFTQEGIQSLMDESAALGVELFVLDDGWFGARDSDKSSLGDWVVHSRKLPGGLQALADHAHRLGMLFGLWFEPEMVSPDSDLYRAHPDWCLHVPGRSRSQGRNQLVLDMGRDDVRQYLYESISSIIRSSGLDYIKWDMNRNMTEVASALLPADRQRESSHRYMLGLYALLERLTGEFPQVLFESCSGGGGRFDPGMLYYMPQTWTSDNTDAYQRLGIQWGSSLAYPAISMGAHVSACPNHQMGRSTPMKTRGNAAMSANLGYELDLSSLDEGEKNHIARQIQIYKEIRQTIQFGTLLRLLSPFEGNETSWMYISEDGAEVVLFYFRRLAQLYPNRIRVKLRGLDAEARYRSSTGELHYGDALMNLGLPMPALQGDFDSFMTVLTRV